MEETGNVCRTLLGKPVKENIYELMNSGRLTDMVKETPTDISPPCPSMQASYVVMSVFGLGQLSQCSY
jgi:hypothetical protein